MRELKGQCPHCGKPLVFDDRFEGCQVRCPACQVEMVIPHTPRPGQALGTAARSERSSSAATFWIVLLVPVAWALLTLTIASSPFSKTLFFGLLWGGGIGFVFPFGIFSSAFCAQWLAKKFCERRPARIAAGIAVGLGLLFVNCMIVLGGCMAGVNPIFEK